MTTASVELPLPFIATPARVRVVRNANGSVTVTRDGQKHTVSSLHYRLCQEFERVLAERTKTKKH